MVGSVANDGATNIGAADSMDGTIIRLQRQEQKEKEAKAQQSKAAEAQIMASEGGYMKPAPEFKPSSETASGLMGLMSLVAVSGAMLGMKGRTSGLMAINAASGMMEGYNKGRNELFEQQKQQFEQHMKSWEQNRTMLKEAFDRALKIAPTNLTLAQETLNRDLVALGAQPLAAINKRSGPIAAAVAHSQFDSNFEKQAKPLRENAKKLGINISSTADLITEAQAEQAEAKAKIAAEDAARKRRREEAETQLEELKVKSGGLTPDETRKLQADKNWAASIKAQYDKTGEPPVLKTFDEQRIYSSIYKDLPFKTEEPKPEIVLTLDQIIADLQGFGIEDTEEMITLKVGGKVINLRLANIPSEAEIQALYSAEELKGHAWVTRIKCEVLSRSISWVNGWSLKDANSIFIVNPMTGVEGNIRPVLRDLIMGWGQETVNVLWKVLMVHCQKIEDRLYESLPDVSVMTDVEKRFFQKALEEIDQINKEILKDTIESAVEME